MTTTKENIFFSILPTLCKEPVGQNSALRGSEVCQRTDLRVFFCYSHVFSLSVNTRMFILEQATTIRTTTSTTEMGASSQQLTMQHKSTDGLNGHHPGHFIA
jgi:hypothetical protein